MIVVFIVVLPLLVILIKSGSLSVDSWKLLWKNSIPGLLWRTVKLAVAVAIITIIMGVSTAWLLTRCRFRGSSMLVWVMVIPLAIPTYVYADIYIRLLSESGWLSWLAVCWNDIIIPSSLMQGVQSGWSWLTGDHVILSELTDLLSVALVLSFASFSYVFLMVRASLSRSTQSLEEAARMQGASSQAVFWRVNVPLLRPAIAASMAIVVLHTISDFGAVNILQYKTFTYAVYLEYLNNTSDLGRPAALSLVVVFLAMTFLILERFFRSRQKYYSNDNELKESQIKALLGWKKVLVWLWIGLIATFAVLLPVSWIVVNSVETYLNGKAGWVLWDNSVSSFLVAATAATVALAAGFPVAYYHSRRKTLSSAVCMHASNVGFVLPGPIIALGVLIIATLIFSEISSTVYLVIWIAAVSIRYLPLAVQAQESLLQQLTPSMEQAGRILGASSWENLKRVILPIIKPGMISAWVLVFIDALKELPAALLLRQIDVNTLPVMIWEQANEELIEGTALASLMLIVATLPAIWLMMRGQRPRKSS